jgi:hypothetical protein
MEGVSIGRECTECDCARCVAIVYLWDPYLEFPLLPRTFLAAKVVGLVRKVPRVGWAIFSNVPVRPSLGIKVFLQLYHLPW